MSKPFLRFEKQPLDKTLAVMDGDGTVYKPFIRWMRLVYRTKKNFKNADGSFDLDGFTGTKIVKIKTNG